MLTFMEQIDLFGKNIGFKYKNEERYKNTFGGILTIFTILISLTIYIYFLKNYIERKESKIIYKPEKYNISPSINLTEQVFSLQFEISVLQDKVSEVLYSIDDVLKIDVVNTGEKNTKLEIKNCSKSHECKKVEFNNGEMLTDSQDDGILVSVTFRDREAFKKQFNNSNIVITTRLNDISFNLDDYTNPFQYLGKIHEKTITWDSITRNTIYFIDVNYGIATITTDYAWFFETSNVVKNNLTLFKIEENREIFDNNNIFLYLMKIHLTNEGHSFKKSFQKLSEFLANASSVSSIVFLIFEILSETYKFISLDAEMLNSIFQYDSINKTEPIVINLEFNDVKEQRVVVNVNEIGNNSKGNFDRKINYFEPQKLFRNTVERVPKFNKHKIVIMAFCSCYRKQNRKIYSEFEAGNSILNSYLNFDNYLLKMIELDYLKYLIMNKDQLSLLKCIKLDYLSNTHNNDFMSVIKNSKDYALVCNSKMKMNQIKDSQALISILQKQVRTEIDKKLLNSVGFVDFNQSRIFSYP